MPPDRTQVSQLILSLLGVTDAHPHVRKRLIGTDINYGRELLVALARVSDGWIGWEAATLRSIADAIAFVPLAERGVRIIQDIEIAVLVNRALQHAIDAGQVGRGFAALAGGLGFRRALRDTVLELRMAGVSADAVRHHVVASSPGVDLPAVLHAYERLLDADGLADPAEVFRTALDAFDRESPFVLDGITTIVPSLSTRGLPGALLNRLVASGAVVLDADVGEGVVTPEQTLAATQPRRTSVSYAPLAWAAARTMPSPDNIRLDADVAHIDLFAAATPSDEIREVFRRILAEGVRWDDVEIVTTDPDAYGIALDALCQRLDLGVTMLHGLPLARTRLGRILERWLTWLDDGLPADVLRQALEAGELSVPDATLPPTALARELRVLRIGWGRARYDVALARLTDAQRLANMTPYEDERDDDFAARRAMRARAMDELATLLGRVLDITPQVPERGSDQIVSCSCAILARATLQYLELVPTHGPAEAHTLTRLRSRLEEVERLDHAPSDFNTALATLRDTLADVRAWPLMTSDRTPWRAAGGMVHLTDTAHAGTTGRRRVFVVGLDADRTLGRGRQDPLLPDAVRRAVAPAQLTTSAERGDELTYWLALALATLRGRVTLSYATSGQLDGSQGGPSPILLQVWRLLRGDPLCSYQSLRDALMPPASAVPVLDDVDTRDVAASRATSLDARDVWLDTLADGALLLDGTALVREAFPSLDAGLLARAHAEGDGITVYHGVIPDAGAMLDPTAPDHDAISPSSLETLAKCPLAWFYKYGLSLRTPRDPEYDATRWLDALQRGALLHQVYEAFAREYQGRQDALHDDAARTRILAIAADAIAQWRRDIPPPAETVFVAEADEIRRSALAFLQMERTVRHNGDGGAWLHFETSFGMETPPAAYPFPNGRTLPVCGRVDRVDELTDGTLRVVDYKTGGAQWFGKSAKHGAFNGGRQLQPALYMAAVAATCGAPVSRFEYRFPTERGDNEIVTYTDAELRDAPTLIHDLLHHVRAGEFIPTNDSADCSHCEYQEICRANPDEYGNIHSPRAAWAKEHAAELSPYTTMIARRTREG